MLKRTSFLLLLAAILIMVAATIIEKFTGSATAIYGSWWFAAVWAMLAICGVFYLLRRHLLRRPVVLLLHLSFVIILLGALITHLWGQQGVIHLRLDEPSSAYITEQGRLQQLPFSVTLTRFDIQTYPGTQTPMDYVSALRLSTGDTLTVAMNHIGQQAHYRFYQSSYDSDLQGSLLSVSYDPVGIGVTYLGYGLLFLSMALLLLLPHEGFRRTLRQLGSIGISRSLWLPLALLLCAAQAEAKPRSVPAQQAHEFCSLYVYYNGRICPLQTVARDFTIKLYGRPSYKNCTAEQVFTGWVLFPLTWQDEPLKERKGQYAYEQKAVQQMLLSGQFTRLFPIGDQGAWYSPHSVMPNDVPEDQWTFIRRSLDYLAELAGRSDYEAFSTTVAKIRRYQQREAHDVLPSDSHFQAELFYNQADYTRPLAMAFATLGILLFIAYVVLSGRQRSLPAWLIYTCHALLGLAFGYLLLLFGLRWYVSGHLPLSNGFETMQFMALCLVLLTFVLQRRMLLVIPMGFLLCGLTLLVSTFGQSNPQITHLVPVLQSPLLSIHVCIIMVSYCLLAFTFMNGIAYLVGARFTMHGARLSMHNARLNASDDGGNNRASCIDNREPLTQLSRLLLYPALFCLAAGIFIGAIWANVSWGRYWGWDPKEVWALITLLVYSFALHSESLPWFRRPGHFHLFMVLAFLTVLMTYFGVNFLLGGMHSYANG